MDLSELKKQLNIEIDLEKFAPYFPLPKSRENELCTIELIERLQKKFNLFSEYYEDVKAGFFDLLKDANLLLYMHILSLYIKDCTIDEGKVIVCPSYNGTAASAMLPLLVHLPSIERLYEDMRNRGFTDEEAKSTLKIYYVYMREEKLHRGGYVGISPAISAWMTQFTKGQIFYPGYAGLNFQLLNIAHNDPYFLRNRQNGEIIALSGEEQTFHRSGKVLGSAGCEDEEGSFKGLFEETETDYIGNPIRNYITLREPETFFKTDWELVLKPLDRVLCTHIFWDADLSPELVDKALSEAKRYCEQYYPECGFKGIYCSSWMMNPLIGELLGKESKIDKFASRFMRYHKKSFGTLYRSFVFPGKYNSIEEFPETTRLQKGFKKRLLEGGYIYETPGVIIF